MIYICVLHCLCTLWRYFVHFEDTFQGHGLLSASAKVTCLITRTPQFALPRKVQYSGIHLNCRIYPNLHTTWRAVLCFVHKKQVNSESIVHTVLVALYCLSSSVMLLCVVDTKYTKAQVTVCSNLIIQQVLSGSSSEQIVTRPLDQTKWFLHIRKPHKLMSSFGVFPYVR